MVNQCVQHTERILILRSRYPDSRKQVIGNIEVVLYEPVIFGTVYRVKQCVYVFLPDPVIKLAVWFTDNARGFIPLDIRHSETQCPIQYRLRHKRFLTAILHRLFLDIYPQIFGIGARFGRIGAQISLRYMVYLFSGYHAVIIVVIIMQDLIGLFIPLILYDVPHSVLAVNILVYFRAER